MDKRSRKTQEAIAKAFQELVQEKGGISKVSVRDIANRANISRSTFYSHYDDIDDLTEAMKEGIASKLGEIILKHAKHPDASGSSFEMFRLLFLEILNFLAHQDFLTEEIIVNGKNTGITETLSNNISDLISDHAKQSNQTVDPDILRGTALFLTYGGAGMVKDWFVNHRSASPDSTARKMAEVIDSLVSIYSHTTN